ncbi:F-box/WD repeat-containing protein 8 isoform X2 [Pantherophis guttatus]|uniref:F-box/WD repeat-containing protein 8 isoform X2 n=1 Tax=Pantherophis guttatus TaxID=94885 RepID=A0ABM3YUF1_PANGU|nr:F-box/WD repeat-containing protein 8 isoform X2 [Pantherophis guttatus]
MVEDASSSSSAALDSFRRRWQAELARDGPKRRWKKSRKRPREAGGEEPPQPVRSWGGYGALLEGLLEEETPLQSLLRVSPGPEGDPGPGPAAETPAGGGGGGGKEDLLGQLIRDLNEINEVPFFDVQLPYELALKIFQSLGRLDLGRCAQVSRTWKVLAEDQVLWFRLCQQEGYLSDSQISDFPCWKQTLRECREKEQTLRANWKNRIGVMSQLQHEVGNILCDVHSCNGVVIAGYTSGDVKLWDTRTWDYSAPVLEPEHGSLEPGPRPHASFVRINSSLAASAYEDGSVKVWSLLVGSEPIHRYQHNQKIQAMALSTEGATVATAAGFQVKVESANDKGYWGTLAEFEVQKWVSLLSLMPQTSGCPAAVVAAEDAIYFLKEGQPAKVLHCVYGQPVTSLDVSAKEVAFGVRGYGWLINETNKILLYNVETGQCVTQLGGPLGDFTCLNLQDSPPHMLVAGNKVRRVMVYDLRRSEPVSSLCGHQLGVSAVQMDDWKVVSGGEEGLVCVWDQRMGNKLWEMHARHPVRHLRFNSHSLITANVPNEKTPRGASITDDDLTAHRRHRGVIYAYEFSVDQLVAESVLPICRSSYNETIGYNYNIGLVVPYDNI